MAVLKSIALFTVLCLALELNAEVKTTLHKHVPCPNGTIPDFSPFLRKDNFVYENCNTNQDQSELKCEIVLSSEASADKTCNLTYKPSIANGVVNDFTQVYQFGPKRAILFWTEELKDRKKDSVGNVISSVIDFANCKSSDNSIKSSQEPQSDLSDFDVKVHEDSYDVVLPCDKRVCRLTVHVKDEQVKEPTLKDYPVTTLALRSPFPADTAHFIHQSLFLIKSDGTEKLLKEVDARVQKGGPKDPKLYYTSATSDDHDAISAAIIDSTNVIIWQFDKQGKSILDTKVELGYNTIDISVRNLEGGGLLLLTSKCAENCNAEEFRYYVRKIGADGRQAGPLELKGPAPHCDYMKDSALVELFETDSKEQCMFIKCYVDAKQEMNLLFRCFSEEDFSV